MPVLRPFRGLRFDMAARARLDALICPPYDVISQEEARRLRDLDPHNVVRLELPEPRPAEPSDQRYRNAARDLVAWRSTGILRKDRLPSVYAYEQSYRVPNSTLERRQRGFLARLRLEPFGPTSGVRPHERTMSGPKEDRYQLLRATGANLSPVVMLSRIEGGESAPLLDAVCTGSPVAEAVDRDGVRHVLWAQPISTEGSADDRSDATTAAAARALLELAGSRPLTIADGHHRYETALRYRDERGRHRACESDPAYDYVLCLVHDISATSLTVLPTHRLVRTATTGDELLDALEREARVQRASSAEALVNEFGVPDPGTTGRIGVWSGGRAAIVEVDRARSASLVAHLAETVRWLDVNVLAALLERVVGIDEGARAAGAVAYTKDAAESIVSVDRGDADACFLLHPTPVEAVIEAASAGEVMPQKSTYFYPKAATGLVINMLED